MRPALLSLMLLLPFPVLADEAPGNQVIVIDAERLIDPASDRVIAPARVVVADGRIKARGERDSVQRPEDARHIRLGNRTLLPGLIDAHVHLHSDAGIQGYDNLGQSEKRRTLYGVRAARKTLEAGFTTVRNVGAPGYADVATNEAIRDGDFPGPRMRVAGPSIGMTGGHCDSGLLPPEYEHEGDAVADGPWEVRQAVRENFKYGVDTIKFCATGGVMSKGTDPGPRQYSLEEMKALVDEAHTHGLPVAAHAHGTEGIHYAIRAGVDSVEHASFLDERAIELALENDTTLVMDVYVSDFILGEGEELGMHPESLAAEREVGERQRESLRQAHEAGVEIAFGSDAGVYPHGDNGRQFSRMVDAGMAPMEALRAATGNAAELLQWEEEIGRIAEGFHADLIAVPGDPREEIEVMEEVGFVMKGGEIKRTP